MRDKMNMLTNFENVILEYNLSMCHHAVEIIGQNTNKNVKKIEKGGTEDNSYNLLNVHFSSAGIGIGVLIVLVFVYKIIKASNVKSWEAICKCLFPCSPFARNGNTTPTQAQQQAENNMQFNQSNSNHLRTESAPVYNPMFVSEGQNKRS